MKQIEEKGKENEHEKTSWAKMGRPIHLPEGKRCFVCPNLIGKLELL
jgi:hypothetical protein